MLNLSNIMDTIRMIDQQHLDIRTITMGISLLSCIIMVLAGIFGILGIKPIFRRILGVVLLALTLLPMFMNSVLLGHTGKDLIITAGDVIFYILYIIL